MIIEAEFIAARVEKYRNREERSMERYMKKDIKELIETYPAVGDILDEYGIGCVPCTAGKCQLSDVIEIHNLPPEGENQMMTRIASVLFPDGKVKLPEMKRTKEEGRKITTYSPPVKLLVDEHVFIYRWAELIPEIIEKFDFENEGDRQLLFDGIEFIRSYADRYHHAKEEDILFAYFDQSLDIIHVMYEDHNRARSHVKGLFGSLQNNDREGISHHLGAYGDILREHIKKEDEILYPWMDRNLTTPQVGELYSRFNEVEKEFGEAPAKHEAFIKKLEEVLRSKEVAP